MILMYSEENIHTVLIVDSRNVIALLFVIYLCTKNFVFYRQSENFIQLYTLVISAVSYKLVIYHILRL